jgi:archaeal type IV pilus assembly protein PilA
MSKANQAFKQNDEAVSPVIGVILMVAITVVLAAVVFVLVSNLGKGSEKAPNVSFNKDSSARTLTVVQADPGVTWDDFTASGTCSPTINGGAYAASSTDTVSGGDVIGGCTAGQTFSLTHIATNSLVYTTTFA